MDTSELEGILAFIKEAEKLKDTLRYAFTSMGKHESSAEHSWRLALFALVLTPSFPHLNNERCLQLALIHDLAEAVCSDTPAPLQKNPSEKLAKENKAFKAITASLPAPQRSAMLALWDEYTMGESPEARYIKTLDKLETLIQHNQGNNPQGFDYRFNLTYGLPLTKSAPILQTLRELIDEETRTHLEFTQRQGC